METSVQTKSYQDPSERSFEKRFPWTYIFTQTDNDSPVHVVADDMSGRQVSLPVGVILEIAEALQFQRALAN